jgi:hypothetical protein
MQGTGEESVFVLAFGRIKIAFAQTQQTEIAPQVVAASDTRADRKGQIHQAVDVDALEILANQCQTGVVAQVEGQLFDNEICDVSFTCWVKSHMENTNPSTKIIHIKPHLG